MKAVDYQALYTQLGRLLETQPEMDNWVKAKQPAALQWLGRAHAMVDASGSVVDAASFTMQVSQLRTTAYDSAMTEIMAILYRTIAKCEVQSPGTAGSFIPVGNSFDAFTALSKLFESAKSDVIVVDPYMDESALTEFGLAVPEGVTLRLLADQTSHKPTLPPASLKWIQQYGKQRPLQVRLASPKTLHDRAIFIDQTAAWTLTQSLKDFAKRSPAEIVRADATAALKIAAYEAIWAGAPVVIA